MEVYNNAPIINEWLSNSNILNSRIERLACSYSWLFKNMCTWAVIYIFVNEFNTKARLVFQIEFSKQCFSKYWQAPTRWVIAQTVKYWNPIVGGIWKLHMRGMSRDKYSAKQSQVQYLYWDTHQVLYFSYRTSIWQLAL